MAGHDRPVIVVEDDASMTNAMQRILRLGGFPVIAFASAEEMMKSGVGDARCLIVDLQLPGMSGFDLREGLVAAGDAPPVIFITAFDDPETRRRAESSVGAVLLTKPFSGHMLLDTVRRVSIDPLNNKEEP